MSAVTVSRVCAGKFCGRVASGATAPLAKDRLLPVGDHVVSSPRCIVKTGGAVEGIRPTIVEDIARVILMINKERHHHPVQNLDGNDPALPCDGQRPHRGRAAFPPACRPRCRQGSPASLNSEQTMSHMASSDADWLRLSLRHAASSATANPRPTSSRSRAQRVEADDI